MGSRASRAQPRTAPPNFAEPGPVTGLLAVPLVPEFGCVIV
jgi:hypothetical protein